MHDTLRYWLDRGVDGFRSDVVNLIGKGTDVEDLPEHLVTMPLLATDRPFGHELLRRIRSLLDSYEHEPMMVGEVYLLRDGESASYVGHAGAPELHLSFDFRPAAHVVGRRPACSARWRRWRPTSTNPAGRRSCCRTTTSRVIAPATARRGAGPSCGRDGAHRARARRFSTPARSWDWRTPWCRRSGSSIPTVATAAAPRSRGRPTATTRPATAGRCGRGCRSRRTHRLTRPSPGRRPRLDALAVPRAARAAPRPRGVAAWLESSSRRADGEVIRFDRVLDDERLTPCCVNSRRDRCRGLTTSTGATVVVCRRIRSTGRGEPMLLAPNVAVVASVSAPRLRSV